MTFRRRHRTVWAGTTFYTDPERACRRPWGWFGHAPLPNGLATLVAFYGLDGAEMFAPTFIGLDTTQLGARVRAHFHRHGPRGAWLRRHQGDFAP